MSSNLSITIHNIMPERASEGVHVPFHTIIMEPFERPFTFGPNRCDVKNGFHIGLDSKEAVAGAFVGKDGEFLVMSANQFAVITPKDNSTVATVGSTLFPKSETHDLKVAEKGRSYPIKVGSALVAYSLESTPSIKTITFFLGVGKNLPHKDEIYRSALGAMAQSLVYFNKIWLSLAVTAPTGERSISKDQFNPQECAREKCPDMKIEMFPVIKANGPSIAAPLMQCGVPKTVPSTKRQKI